MGQQAAAADEHEREDAGVGREGRDVPALSGAVFGGGGEHAVVGRHIYVGILITIECLVVYNQTVLTL